MIVVRRDNRRAIAAARGLTLLEILVALAILLAIAGLVVPTYLESLNRRAFESAEQMIVNQFILARAHAQTTGRPVEVRYEPDTRIVRARLFNPQVEQGQLSSLDVDGENPDMGPAAGGGDTEGGDPFGSENPELDITEPWAARRLGNGIRLTRQRPWPDDSGGGALYGMDDDLFDASLDEPGAGSALPAFDMDSPDESYRLVVFVPDGSALLSRTVWITDERSRASRLEINSWTGMARLERVDRAASPTDAMPADEFAPAEPAERRQIDRSADNAARPAGPSLDERGEDEPEQGR